MIATTNGVIVRQKVDAISTQGRMATGVRIQQLQDDDQVGSVTPLVEAKEETADGATDEVTEEMPEAISEENGQGEEDGA
jgi:DNA gyrase subunit A